MGGFRTTAGQQLWCKRISFLEGLEDLKKQAFEYSSLPLVPGRTSNRTSKRQVTKVVSAQHAGQLADLRGILVLRSLSLPQ
eukprot:743424-Amphidinium_carterae.1